MKRSKEIMTNFFFFNLEFYFNFRVSSSLVYYSRIISDSMLSFRGASHMNLLDGNIFLVEVRAKFIFLVIDCLQSPWQSTVHISDSTRQWQLLTRDSPHSLAARHIPGDWEQPWAAILLLHQVILWDQWHEGFASELFRGPFQAWRHWKVGFRLWW